MASTPKRYGSISSDEQEVELLPTGEAYIGTVDDEIGSNHKTTHRWHSNRRHHCLSYTLAALTCLFTAHYWHNRAQSYNNAGENNGQHSSNNNNKIVHSRSGRVPMPPALSTLDPAIDLGFRSTTRSGLALPSKAWGEHSSKVAALPTNEWYLNLLSHVAASDPSKADEIAHVYTIPYVLGVAPPHAPKLPSGGNSKATTETMAGIELFLPILKAGDSNMQMVFDKNNGISLGAIVEEESVHAKGTSSLTSYVVDPNEDINPLGVSLKWNYVNVISHIVRGMPYGTLRFGKDSMNKSVLPTILAGNRARSILIDTNNDNDDDTSSPSSSNKKKMECGSFTGQSIDQDPNHPAAISSDGKANVYSVEREIILHMDESDFTWVVFFSKPVKVQCYTDAVPVVSVPGSNPEVEFRLNVVEVNDGEEEELVVRVALLNECTSGKGIIKEHCEHLQTLGYDTISSKNKSKEYLEVLRKGAMLYPKSPLVGTQFPEDDNDEEEDKDRVTNVVFDWDVTSANSYDNSAASNSDSAVSPTVVGSVGLRATSSETVLMESTDTTRKDDDTFIMFALPHHLESLSSSSSDSEFDNSLCLRTFHGRTCLVQGSFWNMPIAHGPPQSFLADRPPAAVAIPLIADALSKDINFKLSDNVLRGAADTYFPAKIVAKMGRVIEINNELQSLKSGKDVNSYSDADEESITEASLAAAAVTLPSEDEVESLLDDLQQAVEIWLKPGGKQKGGAEAEFIYDESWGGLVNCGCKYSFTKGHEGEGSCNNTFPECPALVDVNEDFGNGWYNDHHFHYGYMIYAAAIVAKNRPEWGREYYDRVLLYIRDIANPSADDGNFPMFRQKDWYLGNSWAGGLMSMQLSPHGREQESSSEAIAAFEGIALFGDAMMDVFAADEAKLSSARLVRNVGELLTAMEVSAANRFWHVWGSTNSTNLSDGEQETSHVNSYPPEYTKPVVGMLYETMANFQTWFAPEDVVSYGIQLIPLTSVAERRDDPEWSSALYPIYAESCQAANEQNDGFCDDNGWSIVQTAVLAETGEIDDALKMASDIPASVFISEGACGNSLTNTLWFISTRKQQTTSDADAVE